MIASSGLSIVCVCCQSWKGDPLWNWNPCLLEFRVKFSVEVGPITQGPSPGAGGKWGRARRQATPTLTTTHPNLPRGFLALPFLARSLE